MAKENRHQKDIPISRSILKDFINSVLFSFLTGVVSALAIGSVVLLLSEINGLPNNETQTIQPPNGLLISQAR